MWTDLTFHSLTLTCYWCFDVIHNYLLTLTWWWETWSNCWNNQWISYFSLFVVWIINSYSQTYLSRYTVFIGFVKYTKINSSNEYSLHRGAVNVILPLVFLKVCHIISSVNLTTKVRLEARNNWGSSRRFSRQLRMMWRTKLSIGAIIEIND